MTDTRILPPDAAGIAEAARLVRGGELVAFPTETVYGLGADATRGRAVAAIFSAKDRPRFNPLILHLPDTAAARQGIFPHNRAGKNQRAIEKGKMHEHAVEIDAHIATAGAFCCYQAT